MVTVLDRSDLDFQNISASAVALDGFTVRQDYSSVVRNYLREEVIFWNLLDKEAAESDPVTQLREGPEPAAGFISKIDLNPPESASDLPAHQYSDAGQGIKAFGGVIKTGHYAQSLYDQQGRPYGDIVSRKTEKLIIKTAKTIEKALFVGDAATNPLAFNGLSKQMRVANAYTCNVTTGDSVVKKLRGIVRLAVNDEEIMRGITHIFCTGLGLELIEEEVDTKLEYQNLETIRPGLKVPSIITQGGIIPIIPTPYINDTDGGAGTDTVHYWLVDMNSLKWKGVYPKGGQRTFDPQIFDASIFTGSAPPYLLEKRMCLAYGTLYVDNLGEGVYKLSATVPSGTVGNI